MKKIVYFSSALFTLEMASSTVQAFAAGNVSEPLCPPGFTTLCQIRLDQGSFLGPFIEFLLIIAIIICLFYLVWGGVRYIMSGGDKGKADQARSSLVAALVGLVIALSAFFIMNLVLSFFGLGLSTLKVPTLLSK